MTKRNFHVKVKYFAKNSQIVLEFKSASNYYDSVNPQSQCAHPSVPERNWRWEIYTFFFVKSLKNQRVYFGAKVQLTCIASRKIEVELWNATSEVNFEARFWIYSKFCTKYVPAKLQLNRLVQSNKRQWRSLGLLPLILSGGPIYIGKTQHTNFKNVHF